MAVEFVAGINGLTCEHIQADEIHGYIGARRHNVAKMKVPTPEAGVLWTYLAICADSKFIITYGLSPNRSVYDTTAFFRKIKAKLKVSRHGAFEKKPTIVTDGMGAYKEAGAVVFGTDINQAMMIKKYKEMDANGERLRRSRYIGADRITICGIHSGRIFTRRMLSGRT